MIPFGGFALIIHLMINIYHKIIRRFVHVRAMLIIFFIACVSIANGGVAVTHSLDHRNTYKVLETSAAVQCNPIAQPESLRKAILRVDDVQAYAYYDATRRMLEDAEKYNKKLVLGVIPKDFSKDKKIVNTVLKHSCNAEIAMHGYDHSMDPENESHEFDSIDETLAKGKIILGKRELTETLGQEIHTFIPPGNQLAGNIRKVFALEGISYISEDDYGSSTDMTVSTYDFRNDLMVDNRDVLEACLLKFAENKPCVIVLHPQDYMTGDDVDEEKYSKYIELLKALDKLGVYSTTVFEYMNSR